MMNFFTRPDTTQSALRRRPGLVAEALLSRFQYGVGIGFTTGALVIMTVVLA